MEFSKECYAILCKAYNHKIDKDEYEVYRATIKNNYSNEVFEQAIGKIIQTATFFPKPCEVLEMCRLMYAQLLTRIVSFMNQQHYFQPQEVSWYEYDPCGVKYKVTDIREHEYTKALQFATEGIIPAGMREIYAKYYKQMREQNFLQNNIKLLTK